MSRCRRSLRESCPNYRVSVTGLRRAEGAQVAPGGEKTMRIRVSRWSSPSGPHVREGVPADLHAGYGSVTGDRHGGREEEQTDAHYVAALNLLAAQRPSFSNQ